MSVIDDVKARLDIVTVIGAYVKLTKSGRSFKGLSPFQSERTPSFFVFPDSQTYKDFSSGEQGDIFSFMMKKEGWTFGEALRELAQRAGVQLEERTEEQKQSQDYEVRLRDACTQAAEYFHRLFLTAPQADHCRKYVKEKRSLTDETIVTWQIGYSLMDYQALMTYMTARGFSAKDLVDAGLVIENDEGRRYDRFRGRLMIPIKDEKGRVVGFGSRSLDGSEPKYMNSPQTPIFDKGRLLFGLDRARAAIRNEKGSVIVEGYMDVIGTHQAGFTNVVAGMGTSLTEDQFRMLKRLADRIVLALDADAAGNRAVLRGVDVARDVLDRDEMIALDGRGIIRHESKLKADIRVALLPDGKDPDEVVLDSPDIWRTVIASAKPVTEHVIDITLQSLDLTDPRAKSEAIKAVAPILHDLSDPVQRDFYIQQLGRRLQLTTRAVAQAISLNTANNKPRKPAPNNFSDGQPDGPPPPDDFGFGFDTQRPNTSSASSSQSQSQSSSQSSSSLGSPAKIVNLELHLIAILTRQPQLLMDANVALTRANLDHLSDSDFMNPALRVGFQQLSRAAMDQPLPEANDDWLTIIADYTLSNQDELFLREEIIRTSLRLREGNLAREQEALFFMISESQYGRETSAPTSATMPHPPTPNIADTPEKSGETESSELILHESMALYNAKLQLVASQKLRAQKALRLRSALNPS